MTPPRRQLVMRNLTIVMPPGISSPLLETDSYDVVRIENCMFVPAKVSTPPPSPRMDLAWLGRTGLLDPAHSPR